VDGVIDLANGLSYVIEMKYVGTGADDPAQAVALDAAVADALAQIDTKGYIDRYVGTGRKIRKLGIAVAGCGKVLVQPVWT
jgi:hypothetical protein